jgi:hypothetical protein
MGILEEILDKIEQQSNQIAQLREIISAAKDQEMLINTDEMITLMGVKKQLFYKKWKNRMPFLQLHGNQYKAKRYDFNKWLNETFNTKNNVN